MAAQRAAGEAFCGRLKAQPRPSALRLILPAAKAALDAEMQMSSSKAAMISMVSRMAVLPRFCRAVYPRIGAKRREPWQPESARSLHKNRACVAQTGNPRV